MKLQDLLKGVAVLESTAAPDTEINEVRYDSRAVRPGDLFVAIRGYATDGHQYIGKALEQGAAAIVCEEAPAGVPVVVVENARRALAEIAANRFGHPADSMVMLGVTGTNGKTTTTYLVKHMLEDAGRKVGLIGTNQNLIGDEVVETERTTPESYELHALFARMRDAGCTHVIMEVSSHSLVLDRVHGIHFAVGAFTNLTQDHLDFHKTMEEYRRAKAMLFTISDKGVINLDDPAAGAMLADAKCPCLTFSCEKDAADLTAKNLQLHADGVEFVAATKGDIARVKLPIPGAFLGVKRADRAGHLLQLGMPLAMRPIARDRDRRQGPRRGRADRHGLHRAHRLRALAGRRGKRAARGARLCQGQGGRAVRLRRRPRPHQAPQDGQHRSGSRGFLHRNERQSAHRRPEGDHRRYPRGHEGHQNAHAGDRRPAGGHPLGARPCQKG